MEAASHLLLSAGISREQSRKLLANCTFGDNGLIEEVIFEGDAIDGVIGNEAEYGFLGIASDQFITSIHVTKGATMLDNFTYSPIPEPATVILLGLGFMALLRKRPT